MASITVTNISPLLNADHLKELFENCGAIKSIALTGLGDARTCLIEFKQEGFAKAAVFLSGTMFGDRKLAVAAVPKPMAVIPVPTVPIPVATSVNIPSQVPLHLPPSLSPPQTMTPLLPTPLLPVAQPGYAAALNFSGADALLSQQALFMPAAASSMANAANSTALAKSDEIARTIYVGNVGHAVTEAHLSTYFSACGEILYVKLTGDLTGQIKYAFVEFKDIQSANIALNLSGSMLMDRAIKVGKANNPIIKTETSAVASAASKAKNLEEIMAKIAAAKANIAKKNEAHKQDANEQNRDEGLKHRSRSPVAERERKSGKRSRSPQQHRGSDRRRSRSRSRDRYRDRRDEGHWRSGGRDRYRRNDWRDDRDRSGRKGGRHTKKPEEGREGMYFNGFAWQPIESPAE